MRFIGMIHLPQTTNQSSEALAEYTAKEADKLINAGFDGVLVENYNDYPFPRDKCPNTTLEKVRRVLEDLTKEYPGIVVGLNLLRNCGLDSLSLACELGLDFIRVNAYMEPVWAPEGLLGPLAYMIQREKTLRGCRIKVYADVNVKHSRPILGYKVALENLVARGRADGVIVTGEATGRKTSPLHVYLARLMAPDNMEVLVGSGVSVDNIGLYMGIADGVIVGTSIKKDGITANPVDPERARRLIEYGRWLEGIRR